MAIPKAPAGMTYLGSLNRGSADASASSQESFYFLSQNAAGWNTAKEDCIAFLGNDAHLVYLETQPELETLNAFIHNSEDTGSQYWIGGKYNSNLSIFEWDNGVPFGSWVPWDDGQPDSATPVTRVSLYTAGGSHFRTNFQTVSLRYICELQA